MWDDSSNLTGILVTARKKHTFTHHSVSHKHEKKEKNIHMKTISDNLTKKKPNGLAQ